MMDTALSRSTRDELPRRDPRRWRALGLLAVVQFMLVLDMTVVNVALPQIKHTLGMGGAGLAWVVNGYVLMAGGLLLLGGRLADIFGRRKMFAVGVAVFALASATAGTAVVPGMLVASRFVQGLGEALAAPAALGLIVVMFADAGERAKALGVWGGLSGLGGMAGTIVSGVLTDLASWRWIFFVNVPVAVVVLALLFRVVPESRMVRAGRLDVAGAMTATAGLVALVYGLLGAASHPWGSWQVVVPLVAGMALLATTIGVEARSAAPLIPLGFFANRTRAAGYVMIVLQTAAFFAFSFLLTLFMQNVLGYSPLTGGLAYLPLGIGIGLGVGLSGKLLTRLGLRATLAVGFVAAAGGLLLISTISASSSYGTGVMPGMLVFGLASGVLMPTTMNAALHGVSPQDSGLGSALQNVMQQVGGALGLSLLVTLALRHSLDVAASGVDTDTATTSGYALAYRIGAVLMIACAAIAVARIRAATPATTPDGAVPAQVDAAAVDPAGAPAHPSSPRSTGERSAPQGRAARPQV